MNLRTTIVLAVLLALGAGGWFFVANRAPATGTSKTIEFLEKDLEPDKLTRIEVIRKGQPAYTLEKVGGEWTLPGKWPVRTSEAQQLVKLLTSLDSRFAPIALDPKADLHRFGLDGDNGVTVKLTAGGKNATLRIGEEPSEQNRFTRATYVKLDDTAEVARLGPGVIAKLDRTQDYFQKRRLFPEERVAKDEDSQEKVEQVAAREIQVKGPDGEFTLVREKLDGKEQWVVSAPVRDRADPAKVRSLLTNLVDLWADRFVTAKDKKLDEMSLDKPEYSFRVARPKGGDITVLVGKISDTKERIVTKPGPPAGPFGAPPKPSIEIVKEEYRYAKLPDNDQIFEIKTDKLKDLAPALSDIRDARVARFKTDDVKKVEIDQEGKKLVLSKEKEKWRIEQPSSLDAENQPINELLDKLANLEARGSDIKDKAEPKEVGLDKPAAKVTLTLEETRKNATDATKEEKVSRTLVYDLGVAPTKEKAKEKGQVFVKLEGWPRVNQASEDLFKLVERDVLAYRQRRVLDVAAADLSKIKIVRGKDEYVLERKDGVWSLTQPVAAKADPSKADQLAGDLARLETTEYVTAQPKAEELDKTYGLATPELKAVLTFSDAKKPEQTLIVGKQRPFKEDYFARLDDGPIMVVKKDVRELLDRDALAYRPAQAWQVASDKIVELRVKKEGEPFTLKKDDKAWRISGPFDATARTETVEQITDELGQLRTEKYVAQGTKELAKFGLEKPYLEIEVVSRTEAPKEEKKDPADKKDEKGDTKASIEKSDKTDAKVDTKDEKVDKKDEKKAEPKMQETTVAMQIGSADESGKSRYARVAGGDAIFLVGEKALKAIDQGALDLLDKSLLSLDTGSVQQIRFQGASNFAVEKKKDEWQVTGSPAPEFKVEEPSVRDLLRPWEKLAAERFAAYGPKIDWPLYGLEKPERRVAVTTTDKDKKAVEHAIALGKETGKGERFARLDQQQAVVVLGPDAVKELSRDYLDFVDARVLKFPFDAVSGIERKMKDGDLELTRRDDSWTLAKPLNQPADSLTADDIVEKTFQLKARRVAAYPAKDLKPFGLDAPAATVTIQLNDGSKHVIDVGATTGKDDERYARVDNGDKVVVLSAELSKHLTAPVLYFADRNLASFGSADRAEVRRGDRKLTFIKSGTSWKLVEPLKADADDRLGDFLQSLFRLRADEIVAGKGADLKSFGLEKPAAEWTFWSGDKEILALDVGAPEKGKEKESSPRRYARLRKGDQVFLVAAKTGTASLAEYRNRKPWDALDAVQVDQLTVTGPQGSFTLRKSDGNWSIAERSDLKVNSKTVTDALDALAGLQAERYVADLKGNLQLHGLQPPVWKFEAKTPSGTRTLLVGRAEGDSQRHYAAVAGNDAIFVLSEEDSRRILKPVVAFVEEKTKQ